MSFFEVQATMLLGEAINAIRNRAEESNLTDAMSITSAKAFAMHDAVHLIFGCDDTVVGEISVHAWMAFATTAPLAEMHKAVASRAHQSALDGIGHAQLLGTWIKLVPRLLTIIWRSLRMTEKLPYDNLDALALMTIIDIRRHYNVRPL